MRKRTVKRVVAALAKRAHAKILADEHNDWRTAARLVVEADYRTFGRWSEYTNAVWAQLRPRPLEIVGLETASRRFTQLRAANSSDANAADLLRRELLIAGIPREIARQIREYQRGSAPPALPLEDTSEWEPEEPDQKPAGKTIEQAGGITKVACRYAELQGCEWRPGASLEVAAQIKQEFDLTETPATIRTAVDSFFEGALRHEREMDGDTRA